MNIKGHTSIELTDINTGVNMIANGSVGILNIYRLGGD